MYLRCQFILLPALITCVLAPLSSPASADSTAGLILSLQCPNEYRVNIWQRYGSGELLYRGAGPLGNLSLGRGTSENTGAAQVYRFEHENYEYLVLGGRGDHQGQGTLEVLENGYSILSQVCTSEE